MSSSSSQDSVKNLQLLQSLYPELSDDELSNILATQNHLFQQPAKKQNRRAQKETSETLTANNEVRFVLFWGGILLKLSPLFQTSTDINPDVQFVVNELDRRYRNPSLVGLCFMSVISNFVRFFLGVWVPTRAQAKTPKNKPADNCEYPSVIWMCLNSVPIWLS